MQSRRLGAVLSLLLVLVGCEKEIEVQPSPSVTQAMFDPGGDPPVVPTPTDLLKNTETGLLEVPVADDKEKPAQAYFDTYLNTLTGFPTSAVIEVRFDADLDARSLGKSTIPVFEMNATGSPTPVADLFYELKRPPSGSCSTDTPCLVRIWNYAGWKRGTTYLAFVVGGSQGVKDTKGQPVVRSATFELVSQPDPICAWDPNRSADAAKGCVLPASGRKATGCCTFNYAALIDAQVKKEVRRQLAGQPVDVVEAEVKRQITLTATSLEQVRRGYGTLLGVLAPPAGGGPIPGLKREDVALLWTFTTVSGNEAVFDPSAAPPRVPTPTDLAKNPATGLIVVPSSPTASPAEKELNAYLSTLDGFPTSTSSSALELILVEDFDTASLAGNLLVYEVGATGLTALGDVSVSYDEAGKRIVVQRKGGLPRRGTTYAFFAMGGANGLRGKLDGKPLLRSPAMTLALSPYPLCTYDAAKKQCSDAKVSSFMDDPKERTGGTTAVAKATRLEQIRLGYDAVLKLLETTGKKREEVVALWTISTVSMTEVVNDPNAGAIPFPNDLMLDRGKLFAAVLNPQACLVDNKSCYQVSIPEVAGETAAEKVLRLGLNTLDGFTTQGSYLAAVTGKVDPAGLAPTAGGALALNVTKLTPAPMSFEFVATAPAITATPQQPLDEKTNYAIVLVSRLKPGDIKPADATSLRDDRGRRLVASPSTAVLRNRYPLHENGKSTIPSVLDDKAAATAELLRGSMKVFFDALEAVGIKREDVVVAWTFRTMSTTDLIPRLRALPYQRLPAPKWTGSFDAALTGYPATAAKDALGGWAKGSFTSWNALDEQGTATFLPDLTKGKEATVPFLLTVPKGTMPVSGWPVVLYAHGTYQSKLDVTKVANRLAAGGYAAIAFDLVYHGDRSLCTEDKHCVAPGTCDKVSGKCSTSLADTKGEGKPDASGARFATASNPFALRDNLRQYVIDASALLRGIAATPGAASGLTGFTGKLDPARVFFLGQSLGAIDGTLILVSDPLIKAANLNVAGAPIGEVIFASSLFKEVLAGLLASLKISVGSMGYLRLKTTYTWVLDPADAGNFAAYVQKKQLPDLVANPAGTTPVPKKQAIVQIASSDQTVPPQFGKYLATAIGIDPSTAGKLTYQNQGHGFLLEPTPDASATKAAQEQTVFFFTNYTKPPSESVCTPNLTTGACP